MVDTHYILIYYIMCLYVIELLLSGLKYRREILKWLRKCFFYCIEKIRNCFNDNEAEERYDEIMKILDEKEDSQCQI